MLTAVLKAVKMLLSCCPKNSQDAAVLTALKAVQDVEKNHPHKDQVQRLIPINAEKIALWAWAMAGDGVGALGPWSSGDIFSSAYIPRPRTAYRFSSLG
jgi:hypothetical protein